MARISLESYLENPSLAMEMVEMSEGQYALESAEVAYAEKGLDELEEAVGTLESSINTLEHLHESLEGGIASSNEALYYADMVHQQVLESIGMSSENVSFEDFNGTQASLEAGIMDTIKAGIKGAGALLKKLWDAVIGFFKKIWNWIFGNKQVEDKVNDIENDKAVVAESVDTPVALERAVSVADDKEEAKANVDKLKADNANNNTVAIVIEGNKEDAERSAKNYQKSLEVAATIAASQDKKAPKKTQESKTQQAKPMKVAENVYVILADKSLARDKLYLGRNAYRMALLDIDSFVGQIKTIKLDSIEAVEIEAKVLGNIKTSTKSMPKTLKNLLKTYDDTLSKAMSLDEKVNGVQWVWDNFNFAKVIAPFSSKKVTKKLGRGKGPIVMTSPTSYYQFNDGTQMKEEESDLIKKGAGAAQETFGMDPSTPIVIKNSQGSVKAIGELAKIITKNQGEVGDLLKALEKSNEATQKFYDKMGGNKGPEKGIKAVTTAMSGVGRASVEIVSSRVKALTAIVSALNEVHGTLVKGKK